MKKQKTKISTPRGVLKRAYVTSTYKPKGDGKEAYRAELIVPPGATGLIERNGSKEKVTIEELYDIVFKMYEEYAPDAIANHRAPGKAKGYDPYLAIDKEISDDSGEETGNYVIRAKQNRFIKLRTGETKEVRPEVVDSAGNEIHGVEVGRKSEGRMRITLSDGFVNDAGRNIGISAYFDAFKVLKLVAPSSGAADALADLDDDEDGFVIGDEESTGGIGSGSSDGGSGDTGGENDDF